MKISLLTIVIFFIGVLSVAAQEYKHAQSGKPIDGGQAYTLPKVGFSIEVMQVKTTLVQGDNFLNYTDKEVIEKLQIKYGLDPKKYEEVKKVPNAVKYSIEEDSTKITAKALPDYSKIFYVDPKAKWNKNQSVSFLYGTNNMLLEGDSSVENKTFDIVVKGISGIGSIVGSIFFGIMPAVSPAKKPTPDPVIPELDRVLNDLKLIEKSENFDIYKDLKAKHEKRYNELFAKLFYKEKKTGEKLKFVFVPKSDFALGSDQAFFRLDDINGGLIFNDAFKEEVIIIKKYVSETVKGSDALYYKLKIKKQIDQQKDYFTARSEEATGFAYNIPLSTFVSLTSPKQDIIYFESASIPQFGIIGYTNTRKEKLTFQLDPLTGELKKLAIEGKAITSEQTGAGSTTAVEIINLAKGESKSTKLENEVKRLENEKKKRDLLNELQVQ